MSDIALRRLSATDSDLADVAVQLNAADSEVTFKQFSADTLREFLSDSGRFYLVATIGGQLAGAVHGYLLLHPTGVRYLYIDEVDTIAQFRRQGVARAMMHEAFQIGRELHATEAWLGTEHDNEPAKALYDGLQPSEVENGPIYTFKLTS
ncbi:MAG TPA: GNAT family N-acetyltransferase [Candidatus Saccharimonas sp.]|nr:GNAT family N-acetyltransferase [Candidatus Saccharimonas sp.]